MDQEDWHLEPCLQICGDVRQLDIESLGNIDAFAFGFPCNDFSVVGEQKGFDGVFVPLYSYGVNVEINSFGMQVRHKNQCH